MDSLHHHSVHMTLFRKRIKSCEIYREALLLYSISGCGHRRCVLRGVSVSVRSIARPRGRPRAILTASTSSNTRQIVAGTVATWTRSAASENSGTGLRDLSALPFWLTLHRTERMLRCLTADTRG